MSFSYFGYDGLYDALYTDQVDILISAMAVLPEKTRDFSYSFPYYEAGQILVSRIGDEIQTPDNIAVNTIAVELGAEGHILANQWKRNKTNLSVTPYKSVVEALGAVVNREADAAIVDSVSGRLFVAQSPNLRYGGQAIASEPYALVVRRDDDNLLDNLNSSLENLEASGTLDRILVRWLDEVDVKNR